MIVIHREKGMLQKRALLNGFPGAIERLRTSLGLLNSSWPTVLPPNALIAAAQTGDRLSYDPSGAPAELDMFANNYRKAMSDVAALGKEASLPDSQLIAVVAVPGDMEKIKKSLPLFRVGIAEATALLQDGLPGIEPTVLSLKGKVSADGEHSVGRTTEKRNNNR